MSDFANKWAESMALPFAQRWGTVALRGLFALLFGLVALFAPGVTMLSLVLLFAAYAFVDGVAELYLTAQCVRHGVGWRRWTPLLLSGLVSLAAAVVALLWPSITVIVFVMLLAFWSFVSGVMMLLTALWFGAPHGRVWLALGGVASILFGLTLAIAPLLGAVVLTWWIGVYAIVLSGALFAMAHRLRARSLS